MQIDGKKISRELLAALLQKPRTERFLAAVLVGENPASVSFLKQKGSAAKDSGIDFRTFRFPQDISGDELRREIGKIAGQEACGALILQLPLPERINRAAVLAAIPLEKDVDAASDRARESFEKGRCPVDPPAVGVVKEILARQRFSPRGKRTVVLGLGFLVGQPVARWFAREGIEHRTVNIGGDTSLLQHADLIVSGTGVPGIIQPEALKQGAGVIDFGYADVSGKLAGDLATSDRKALLRLGFYTPTPGGTGPILVAKLLENFRALAI